MATCRSCGAAVRWELTPAGKRMPLDPEPSPQGNVAIYGGPAMVAVALTADQLAAHNVAIDGPLYLSHFATCPNADQHRKKKP